ncbi:MAG: 3-dehydroquinate synthase [Clostridiales bacterium]|jgi:3-dehydroquinate synthase|nr:3-dehydroquinate synthase [Clostridiales bacterium]
MITLNIRLPGRSYPIQIGDGILERALPELFCGRPAKKAAVVSDETVWSLHGARLEAALRGHGVDFAATILPAGEASKSLNAFERLLRAFARQGLHRNDPVIAFGGGVVGDLAGFAASAFMRGVPFAQIPTTLLAQVDSSVGGKVAVNLPEGKNLVGSFYQPALVIADTGLLASLPRRELNAGLAEVVKYAAIGCDGLLPLLETKAGETPGPDRLARIVELCCVCKAGYVERDERDTGDRMMLNFGHTFGHAVEKYFQFERYNHGEAVAIGMALAARAGLLLGLTPRETLTQITDLLDAAGISDAAPCSPTELIPLMLGDKKSGEGELTLILLRAFGAPFAHKIRPERLLALFADADMRERVKV